MGSLVTALASFLDAKQQDGSWFVRIDDLDPPREAVGAKEQILESLAAHGLLGSHQPGAQSTRQTTAQITPQTAADIDWQSGHISHYEAAIDQFRGSLFYCTCTRRSLHGLPVYPGTCRAQTTALDDAAIRVRVLDIDVTFNDRVLARQSCNASAFGDFIIKRRDGLISYNLATAVDDGADAVTSVVRGQDLLHVTAPQVYLMNQLGLTAPDYAHIPLLTYADGTKLSKQTGAPALRNENAAANLQAALYYLGMQPPLAARTVNEWITWGLKHWDIDKIPRELPTFDPLLHTR